MITAPLRLLARHASWLLAAGIFLGLAWPALARLTAPLFAATVVGILAATLMRQDFRLLRRAAMRWRLLAVVTVWQLLGAAAVVFCVVSLADAAGLFAPESELPVILVLAAACPPILSAIAFALLFRLDAAFTTVLVLITVFLSPITLPLVAVFLVDQPLGISTGVFMLQLAALVGLATLIAGLFHVFLGKAWIDRHADEIDGVAVLLLLLFGVAIMDGVAARLASQPWFALAVLAAAFALNGGQHLLALAIFWWAGPAISRALGIASGNRNLGLLLAAMGSAASPDLALFLALAQLPIYFTPLMLRPFYGRTGADEAPPTGDGQRSRGDRSSTSS